MCRFVRFPQIWGQSDPGDSWGAAARPVSDSVDANIEMGKAKNADHNDERTAKGENAGPEQCAKPAGENRKTKGERAGL